MVHPPGRQGRADDPGRRGDVLRRRYHPRATPNRIAAGPDGNLWFTQQSGNVGRLTPAGGLAEFAPGGAAAADGIAVGSDGNLWFTDRAGRIGRMTPAGAATVFSTGVTAAAALPSQITAGPDGSLWFTENRERIGRVVFTPTVTPVPAGFNLTSGGGSPPSRSVGDLSGNGTVERVTGAGRGGGPRVQVFDAERYAETGGAAGLLGSFYGVAVRVGPAAASGRRPVTAAR